MSEIVCFGYLFCCATHRCTVECHICEIENTLLLLLVVTQCYIVQTHKTPLLQHTVYLCFRSFQVMTKTTKKHAHTFSSVKCKLFLFSNNFQIRHFHTCDHRFWIKLQNRLKSDYFFFLVNIYWLNSPSSSSCSSFFRMIWLIIIGFSCVSCVLCTLSNCLDVHRAN